MLRGQPMAGRPGWIPQASEHTGNQGWCGQNYVATRQFKEASNHKNRKTSQEETVAVQMAESMRKPWTLFWEKNEIASLGKEQVSEKEKDMGLIPFEWIY